MTTESLANQEPAETYAQSLSKLRALGALALGGQSRLEGTVVAEQAYADFTSGVREMLRTDQELRDRLDIDDRGEQPIINEKVVDQDDRPMADVIRDGLRTSRQALLHNPEFRAQVQRNEADLKVAKIVDNLRPGESWFVLSMEPKDELRHYRDTYRELGYREGLSYIQWYSRQGNDRLVRGSFSVDQSDQATWRQLFAEQDVDIPENTSPNDFICYGFKRQAMPDQAETYVRQLRQTYYQRRGIDQPRHSVSEYVASRDHQVRAIFNQYYPALGEAVHTGRNNAVLQDLAATMLRRDLTKLKLEILIQLRDIAQSKEFDDDTARTMDSIIRYSVVEMLRGDLNKQVQRGTLLVEQDDMTLLHPGDQFLPPEALHHQLAVSFGGGLNNNRDYGGCAGQVQLTDGFGMEQGLPGASSSGNPQSAYGGRGNRPWGGSERYSFNQRMYCVQCQAPPKEKEDKKMCGPCGLCRSCDKKAGGHG